MTPASEPPRRNPFYYLHAINAPNVCPDHRIRRYRLVQTLYFVESLGDNAALRLTKLFSMTYQVTNQETGRRFLVEKDETVLEAAIRQAVSLPYGCRNGQCASCKGKIISGNVSYDEWPDALTKDEAKHGNALFCQAKPNSDLCISSKEIETTADVTIKRFPAKVTEMSRLNHDVMRIVLKLPPTFRLQFFAGQYLDFILADGRRRSFSIASAPHCDTHIELHVRHIDGGDFTGDVFAQMKINDIVRIEAPLGSFFLREDTDKPIIFLAGGTGFAPIKGIIEHCIKHNIQREMYFYWGVRDVEDLYMKELVQQWLNTHTNIHYTPVLSDPQNKNAWAGRIGYVHDAVMQDFDDLSDFEVYASGPPVMVYAGRDAFIKKGLSAEYYYSDAFEFSND